MKRKWLFPTLGAAVFLPLACFFYTIHEPPHGDSLTSKVMRWDDGPQVYITADGMDKLKKEVTERIKTEAPESQGFVQVGRVDWPPQKRHVEVMYISKELLAESTQKALASFIYGRESELADEAMAKAVVK